MSPHVNGRSGLDPNRRTERAPSATNLAQLMGLPIVDECLFRSPKPVGFWDPLTARAIKPSSVGGIADLVNDPTGGDPSQGSNAASSPSPYDCFDQPTFAMDLIWSLHPRIAKTYRDLFFAAGLKGAAGRPIRLLRLYFGQRLRRKTEELADGLASDLPLDIDRYNRLAEALDGSCNFPSTRELSAGMGRVLATLHWGIGVDAADIELVPGGDGYNGVRPYVLDYNQCAQWCLRGPIDPAAWESCHPTPSTDDPATPPQPRHRGAGSHAGCSIVESAHKLARKIGHTEFYYPRPSVNKDAYIAFRDMYTATVRMLVEAKEQQVGETV